jgi:hypothetical protein
MGSDLICWMWDYDYCTNGTEFFMITSYSAFFEPPVYHSFSGFIGLNPIDSGLGWSNAPSLVERMYEKDWIDRR